MTKPRYKPVRFDIFKDQSDAVYVGKYIAFVIVGTWSVEIDGLLYLPGDSLRRDLQGEVGEIELQPQVKFMEDLATDPSVSSNKRLKTGKHLYFECLKIQ